MNFINEYLPIPANLLLVVPIAYAVRHSLPFAWHFRVLLPYLIKRCKSWALQSFSGGTKGQPSLRLSDLPIGKDPFQDNITRSFTATIDDCDFLGHLSNSCYPKNLDIARTHYATSALLQFQADGGWIPLASVSFKFIREISMLTRYDIRSSIYAWDGKWFYLKNEFISKDKKGSQILHCISITKHCYKHGRKTIPPWFVLAYCGYSPSSSSDRMNNWNKSQALRLRLQKGNKKSNPVRSFQPGLDQEEWMESDYWDTGDWQKECDARLKEIHQYY